MSTHIIQTTRSPGYLPLVMIASLGIGCRFETSPLLDPEPDSVGAHAMVSPAAAGSPNPQLPANPSAAQPAAAASVRAHADAGMPITPAAMGGGMAPPARLPDPLDLPATAPRSRCDGVGSYGLRITADLVWESSNGLTSAGRGPVELYAQLDVQNIAADSGNVRATARVCGVVLPPARGPLSCGPRQLRFAESLWDDLNLPQWGVAGQYECAAETCSLQLAPSAYELGVVRAPALSFPDADRDGAPGVTVDIAVAPSDPTELSCGTWPGSGSAGTLRVGLLARLQASLRLAADCSVSQVAGTLDAIELDAADCVPGATLWGGGQTQTSDGGLPGSTEDCSPEQRAALDESLPRYRVLTSNELPTSAFTRDASPGAGTAVRALRLAPGAPVTCEQIRQAMY